MGGVAVPAVDFVVQRKVELAVGVVAQQVGSLLLHPHDAVVFRSVVHEDELGVARRVACVVLAVRKTSHKRLWVEGAPLFLAVQFGGQFLNSPRGYDPQAVEAGVHRAAANVNNTALGRARGVGLHSCRRHGLRVGASKQNRERVRQDNNRVARRHEVDSNAAERVPVAQGP